MQLVKQAVSIPNGPIALERLQEAGWRKPITTYE